MRRRVMMVKTVGKNRLSIVAGDILCAKADGTKCVFDAEDYSDIANTEWTPIGVVVIPPSHDVYGTGEGAAIGLQWLSYHRPNEPYYSYDYTLSSNTINQFTHGVRGITSDNYIDGFNYIGTPNNQKKYIVGLRDNPETFPMDFPTDKHYSITICNDDNNTSYMNNFDYSCVPSPYRTDGSRNPLYYNNSLGNNGFSDFTGKEETDKMVKYITDTVTYYDWKNVTSLYELQSGCLNYEANFSIVTMSAYRYSSVGTNEGDWYIPSVGECGYIKSRFITINHVLHLLTKYYGSTTNNQYYLYVNDTGTGGDSNICIPTTTRSNSLYKRAYMFHFGDRNSSGFEDYGYSICYGRVLTRF